MLSLEHGIPVPLFRPTEDFGDRTYPSLPTRTIEKAGRIIDGKDMTGRLYVYRAEDVQDGDKVRLPEGDFIINGPAENDMVHPMNGHDFGVKRFNLERG
ncbi:hypothetical protein [Mycolicibacterium porcinum]|uniref:hypothetical protein n=1 Tax=Mycolicibacterium porcinum TaxID=39693 RepID=UPI001041C6F1|nr:hypothetical protein [Mycolicibacterium porcinum]